MILASMFHKNYFNFFVEKEQIINKIYFSRDTAEQTKALIKELIYASDRGKLYLTHLLKNVTEEVKTSVLTEYDKIDNYKSEDILSHKQIITDEVKKLYTKNCIDDFKITDDLNTYLSDMAIINKIINPGKELSNYKSVDFLEIDPEEVQRVYMQNPIKLFLPAINDWLDDGGLIRGQLILISAPPGVGKSMFLLTQALHLLATTNENVIYYSVGDLNEYHFLTRVAGIVLNLPKSYIIRNFKESIEEVKKRIPALCQKDRFKLVYITAGTYSANELLDDLTTREITTDDDKKVKYIDYYSQIIVDYDAQLSGGDDNMYIAGGNVLNVLKNITTYKSSITERPPICYVATQPTKESWSQEFISMDQATSESSKKVRIADMILTLSYPQKTNTAPNATGVIYIAKERNGGNFKLHYIRDKSCRIYTISDTTYNSQKVNGHLYTGINEKYFSDNEKRRYGRIDKMDENIRLNARYHLWTSIPDTLNQECREN